MHLYLDIETVPPPIDLTPFVSKAALQGWPVEKYAALSPVLARVVCVAVIGVDGDQEWEQCFIGEEADILRAAAEAFQWPAKLVGHGIRNFDLPTLSFALARHQMPLPAILRKCREAKPWDAPVIDTADIVRRSLQEACVGILGADPKGNGDGGNVQQMWERGEIDKIATYCQGDVRATRALAQRLGVVS